MSRRVKSSPSRVTRLAAVLLASGTLLCGCAADEPSSSTMDAAPHSPVPPDGLSEEVPAPAAEIVSSAPPRSPSRSAERRVPDPTPDWTESPAPTGLQPFQTGELPPSRVELGAATDGPTESLTEDPMSGELLADVPMRLPGGDRVVRVYYGTNRNRASGGDGLRDPDRFYGVERSTLDLGVLEVSIPGSHRDGEVERPRWYAMEREDATRHVVLQRVVPLGERLFVRELRADVARDHDREAFIYVHGFNVSFAEAAWRAGQMKADLEFGGPAVLYSWPSLGRPDPVSYGRDQRRARKSRRELLHFLRTIAMRSGADRVHVIAHSMGNELVVPALAALEADPSVPDPLFDQLVLAAPDIDAETFRVEIAGKLDRAARRTTIYAADHDAALMASVAINRAPRLGLMRSLSRGVGNYPYLDLVDASPIEFRFFELGHSDYGGPLLEDLKATLDGVPTVGRKLARHGRIPRGWVVVGGGGARPPHVPPPADPPSRPLRQPTVWARLTGWWPF